MQALILVGGLGTRLRKVIANRPKPMALVNGKPFLEYVINNLVSNDIKDIILATGYKGEMIQEYFKEGEEFKCKIRYSIEETQLGTGGAIKNALDKIIDDEIMVINGDTYIPLDYKDLYNSYLQSGSKFMMALREVEDAARYGAVLKDEENNIVAFQEKGTKTISKLINAGVYIISKDIIKNIESEKNISLEKDVIPKVLLESIIKSYEVKNTYFIDIGIPEDYRIFCDDVRKGEII